jgi:hypothetical protein
MANPYDVSSDKGRSDWDRRHAFVLSGVWTPYPTGASSLSKVLGGWSLTGVTTLQSGSAVTAYSGQNRAFDGNICAGDEMHPDQVGAIEREHSSRDDMIANYFNRDAFALPGIGTYGTAGRGIFSGPALANTDLAILKDFSLTEVLRLQLRGEFFNLFNNANFNNPVADMTSAQYGRITGARAGRTVQVGAKFIW